jgi:hypothetical protein
MPPWNGHRCLPEITQMTFADANTWYSMFHVSDKLLIANHIHNKVTEGNTMLG